MFEDIIMELDAMGIAFTETEEGDLIIDVADLDKTDLVNIISVLNANDADYTIDAEEIVVSDTMGGLDEDLGDEGMGDDTMMPDMGDLPPMF